MIVEQMTESECFQVLNRTRIGHLACAQDNQPYVVPIYFVFSERYLYAFTTPGQKVEWMRSNPLVCVEVDEVNDSTRWMSIVIFGRYEELPENPAEEQQRLGEQLVERLHTRVPGQRAHSSSAASPEQQARLHAHSLLQQHPEWWEPGFASAELRDSPDAVQPVFYRIHIDRISGRRAIPVASEQASTA
jgi:nitroimidazol reductase NimA-like FMN-containing flavoprotein (pyridoxamine 5'-phosphate oxidase superfamily)